MDAMSAISTRRTIGVLTTPGPDEKTLQHILSTALNAPDHGLLRPWKINVLTGDALTQLGDVFARSQLLTAEAKGMPVTEEQLTHTKTRPQRAPLIIVASCRVTLGHKIPVIEQLMSASALCQNIQIAVHALGFGCIWRTGNWASDPLVKAHFGLEEKDVIAGFMYIGTPKSDRIPKRAEKILSDFVTYGSG